MILDYITPNGNYDGLFSSGGLRIYHVDATLANDEYGAPYLTADNYSPVYDSTHNGRRILRLVNNGNGSYRDGDVIGGTATGFDWYDNNGQLTIDTGYTITVDSVSEDQTNCTITILTNTKYIFPQLLTKSLKFPPTPNKKPQIFSSSQQKARPSCQLPHRSRTRKTGFLSYRLFTYVLFA